MSNIYPFLFLTLLIGSTHVVIAAEDEDETTDLDEIVIVTQQKLVQSDGAKLTYNVSEDPESGSSNILEILRKVPGVTVDAEDNVKVNGQSSFKILMNGREDPMLKGDLKTILKSLPAASIKRIEVISEPGAKYEAEGVGGILNIVTDRSRSLSGFMTQLSAWVNAYQVGGNLTGRTKIRNVMLDATVSYNNGKVWPRSATSHREIIGLVPGEENVMTADQKAKNGWDYTGVNLNMSWEPDTLNLFTLSANYGYNTWYNEGHENRRQTLADLTPLWQLNRNFNSGGKYNGCSVSASYQHNFRRDDNNLVFSYEYDYVYNKHTTDYVVELLQGSISDSPYSAEHSRYRDHSHIFQIDYSNRFSPRHLFEAGAKANINNNGNDTDPYFGSSASDAVVAMDQRIGLNQIKDIYAVYSSYSGTFDKWNVKGGLRYEHTRMGMRYHIGEYSDFTTRLNDIVPNAAISYNLSAASNLRLAYQMRITRPYISQVNPYVNTLTPGTIYYGNPDLKSERNHTISLGYSNYDHKLSGSAKLTYRFADNGVNDVIFMRDGLLHSTYANIGTSHSGTLDMNADWSITNNLRWSVFFSTTYMHLKAESEMLTASNHGWQTNVGGNINYTFPCKVRLSGYGGYWTPWLDLQGKGSDGYYYGIGASRSWLKDDALTVQLSAGNFLTPHRTNYYTQEDPTVKFSYSGRYSQWNVGMSVSFKFGGLSANVKKTAAYIEKEASSSGSQKGGN